MADDSSVQAVAPRRMTAWTGRALAALTAVAVLLLCARPANAQACAGCQPGSMPVMPIQCGGVVGTVNATSTCSSNGALVTLTAPNVPDSYSCSSCSIGATCGTNQQVIAWACAGNSVTGPGLTGCGACTLDQTCCNGMCLDNPVTCCAAGGACGAPNLSCSDNAGFPGCMPAGDVDCLNGTYCPPGYSCTGTTCSSPGGVSCGTGFCTGSTKCNSQSNGCLPSSNFDCDDGYSCPGLESCVGANQCCSTGLQGGACPPASRVPAVADTASAATVPAASMTPAINTGNNPEGPAPYHYGCDVSRSDAPSGPGVPLAFVGLLLVAARRVEPR